MATLYAPTGPLSGLLRDVARTAMGQLFGSTRPRTPRVYWTRDRHGYWILHVPFDSRMSKPAR
jgi:hypothetical protein